MRFTQTAALAAFIACASAADATCTVGKIEAFTDDKCTKAPATKEVKDTVAAAEKKFKESAAAIVTKCVADGKEFKTPACTGAGYGTLYFTDKDCKTAVAAPTDAQKKAFTAWGTCIKAGDLYLKVSDAAYIKAAAVAAVAVAASLY